LIEQSLIEHYFPLAEIWICKTYFIRE